MDRCLKKQLAEYLEQRLTDKLGPQPVFYNELARRFSLPPVSDAWYNHPLCKIFEEFDVEDAARGRPFRTVVVISEKNNRPGEGFFKTLVREGRIKSVPTDESEKMKLFISELEAAAVHFASNATPARPRS